MAVTVVRHNQAYDPVGLWQFNETLNDTSGNAFNMTVEAGTERYTDIYPGLRGIQLINTRLIYNTFTSTLAIAGDLTLECILFLETYPGASQVVMASYMASGETSDTNAQYFWALNTTDGNFTWLSESGAGVNATYTINDGPGLGLCHMAVTRTSNVLQYYLNGRAYGSASGSLTTPDGGGSGRFRVGSPDSLFGPESVMSSLKVCNIALTAAQVAAEYNLTVGPVRGFV